MQILPKYILEKLPSLYTQENEVDPMIQCNFFLPGSSWTWYAIEFDGEDLFFGYVALDYPELGYFRLSELQSVKGSFSLPIERDKFFVSCRLSKITG